MAFEADNLFRVMALICFVTGNMLPLGSKQQMHIGFDDTDSTRQGCTTYVAALLVAELEKLNAKFLDYPRLVRLNPNVPWKTRGNGALCLTIEHDEAVEEQIKEITVNLIEAHSDLEWNCLLYTSPSPRDRG